MKGRDQQFTAEEIARVLSHYNIGVIHKIEPVQGSNRKTSKLIICAEQGKYFLKRRQINSPPSQVAFVHAVQTSLLKQGFPVSALIPTRRGKTMVEAGPIYELFRYMEGTRHTGSAEEIIDAGRQLARLHKHLGCFQHAWKPSHTSFHDSRVVRKHLKDIGKDRTGSDKHLGVLGETLMILYNTSSIRVNELGFDNWPRQIIHGDWHPGNMLFADQSVVAVLDFDGARIAPAIIDCANGLLQFSIIASGRSPTQWPNQLDQNKMKMFLGGYLSVTQPEPRMLEALPDLMIETMIAEAVLPVATTGSFGRLSGIEFLEMIVRKSQWITTHKHKLIKLFKVIKPTRQAIPSKGKDSAALKSAG